MRSRKIQYQAKPRETSSVYVDKLNEEALMSNPTYRRLYNIVKNDMSRSDLVFRKNLIKELYFLLQITPIIRSELKDHFLGEVEKWYNLNDHKKIDLASNKLNKLLNIVHSSSKKESAHSGVVSVERPKSGVPWNQNVSPFLRPYTAKRSQNTNNSKTARPLSSKLGSQSTKVETLEDFCIRQFTTNIQEQLEISQDFVNKHRTNHPEEEPIYQQLYNILKRIEKPFGTDETSANSKNTMQKITRNTKSAIPRKQETMVCQTLVQSEQQILIEDVNENEQNEAVQPKEQNRENDEKDSNEEESSEEEEYLYVQEKKPYKAYSRKIRFEEKKMMANPNQTSSLQKYTHITNNKLVQAMREDRQMAQNYVDFARTKSAMRRELNRKSQSRRLMSARIHSSSRDIRFINKTIEVQQDEQKQNVDESKGKQIDLNQDPLSQPADHINPYPTYNRHNFLKNLYEKSTKKFKKISTVEQIAANTKQNVIRPMTSFAKFHSPIRFDPMSNENVKQYNKEMLEDIQKIKMKIGGKCYASTQCLMKALMIQEPEIEGITKWEEKKNPFYGMVSKGKGKKLKKKGKKNLSAKGTAKK